MRNIQELMDRVREAESAVKSELQSRWPIHRHIEVLLNSRQFNPTLMEVMDHDGQGYVRAYMKSKKAKAWNNRFVKNVYFRDIIGWRG